MTTYYVLRSRKFLQKFTFFLLLTETDGNGQLNISMQQLATSFDLHIELALL